MLFDRQPRRILSISTVLLFVTVVAGCHSTLLQPVATPPNSKTPEDQKPAKPAASEPAPKALSESAERTQLPQPPQQLASEVVKAGAVSSNGIANPVTASLPRVDLPDPQIVRASTSAAAPANSGELALLEDPAFSLPPAQSNGSATPMLDALSRRAEQVQRQSAREAMNSDQELPAVPEPPDPAPQVAKVASLPADAKPKIAPKPTPVSPPVVALPTMRHDTTGPNTAIVVLETPPKPAAKLDPKIKKVDVAKKEMTPSSTPEVHAIGTLPESQVIEAGTSFEISDARLCRRVLSFGSIDPLPAKSLKRGQVVVLYAELTGVAYDQKGEEFHSRASSKLELFRGSSQGGNPVWVETPKVVRDVCLHRRRDFYLNYLIPVPKDVEPGDYVLRLTVNDLVSNRSATSQVPLTIAR